MKLTKYENQICDISTDLFRNDEYSFFVLTKILKSPCRLTITDKERIIICHSTNPYPVWVWMPDNATEEEKKAAYDLVKENFGFCAGYGFNMKYELADYFIKRAKSEGFDLGISLNLFSYKCDKLVLPKKISKGTHRTAQIEDLDLATKWSQLFHEELNLDILDYDTTREHMKDLINSQRLFFWCDEEGEPVAMTSYKTAEDKGSICNVYTALDKRRNGYAANLVYHVTSQVFALSKTPVLYTDADYSASNACYESIGFVKMGSLCTIK